MPTELKINLTKFIGARTFTAKDGQEHVAIPVLTNNIYVGKQGYYCSLSLVENKEGTDQYGNDGFCAVDIGKDRRMAGEKGPIIGNWKAGKSAPKPAAQSTQPESEDNLPF